MDNEYTIKQQWFSKTFQAMKLLIGLTEGTDNILMGSEFGNDGWNFLIDQKHIDYFTTLNRYLQKERDVNYFIKTKWQLLNCLIVSHFKQRSTEDKSCQNLIFSESLNLAASVAFPLLEEYSRIISGYWDNSGIMLKDQPNEVNFLNEKGEERFYKKDKRIIDLSHKLKLMDYSFSPQLKQTLQSLNQTFETNIYEKISKNRDKWIHGRKFDTIISPFISIFFGLIYFGNNQ